VVWIRRGAWLAMVAVLSAACSSGGDDAASELTPLATTTTPATSPTTTAAPVTTTTAPAPAAASTAAPTTTGAAQDWTIPPLEEIDVAYLQPVVDELDRLEGDLFRLAFERGEVDADVEDLIENSYARFRETAMLQGLPEILADREKFFDPPGDPDTTVLEIVERASYASLIPCVLVNVEVDFAAVNRVSGVRRYELVLMSGDMVQPLGRNKTGWWITDLSDDVPAGERCI
jgi:hypothetical protein